MFKRFIVKCVKKVGCGECVYKIISKIPSRNNESISAEEAKNEILRNEILEINVKANRDHLRDCDEFDLSIIIPVYNAERYLEKALDSVVKQKTNFRCQIIIVNDGSKDNSEKIINQYLDKENVVYIKQENAGVAVARNTGLDYVRGRYIEFMDSDDELQEGSIDALMSKAYELNADVVEGSYCLHLQNETKNYCHKDKDEVSAVSDLFGYPWGKVIKSEMFADIEFPKGIEYEDTIISTLIYPRIRRGATISKIVYNYNDNMNGLTHKTRGKKKSIHTYLITKSMLENIDYYHIAKTQELYEFFLKQLRLNYLRMCENDELIQKCAFVSSCELMGKYFDGFYSTSTWGQEMEKILLHKDFRRYALFCQLCSF